MLLQMDAVCFPLEFIFLKKTSIQEFTSLMKHQFVVYIYKIYLFFIGDHNLLAWNNDSSGHSRTT